MVSLWEQREDQLIDAGNEALYLIGISLRNDKEDLDVDGTEARNSAYAEAATQVQTTKGNKPHQALQTEVEKHQADAKAASEHQTASDIRPPKAQVQVSVKQMMLQFTYH